MAHSTRSHAHPSRRQFLQSAGAGILGVAASSGVVAAAPAILQSTNKSGTRPPIVGAGEHTYEVLHDWGTLPAGLRYGNTHGVCEDANGQIYVHHTVGSDASTQDSMVVFDANGRFVRSWGPEFKGGAHGLHIHREGTQEFLYLCDTKRGVVVKTTRKGEIVYTLGYPKESEKYPVNADGSPAIKYSPTNLAIAPNGDLFVGDGYGSSFINKYDREGKFLRTFGGKGTGAGQLDCPHGLIVDTRGPEPLLMVADRGNKRIQTFSLDGEHRTFIGGTNHPCHFHERAGLLVVPDLWARVTLLNAKNEVLLHLGDAGVDSWKAIRGGPRDGFPAGKFVCPHGACFDHAGNIFVVEWVEVGRVTKLRRISA